MAVTPKELPSGTGKLVNVPDPEEMIEPMEIAIFDLLTPIWERLITVRLTMSVQPDIVRYVAGQELHNIAVELNARLSNLADGTGAEAGRAIVYAAFGDEPCVEFWGTELGRLIVMRGGVPFRNFSRAEAGAILRVSRQSIYNAMAAGNLRVDEKDLILRDDVLDILAYRVRNATPAAIDSLERGDPAVDYRIGEFARMSPWKKHGAVSSDVPVLTGGDDGEGDP